MAFIGTQDSFIVFHCFRVRVSDLEGSSRCFVLCGVLLHNNDSLKLIFLFSFFSANKRANRAARVAKLILRELSSAQCPYYGCSWLVSYGPKSPSPSCNMEALTSECLE